MSVADPRMNRPDRPIQSVSEKEQIDARLAVLRASRIAKSLDLSELDASIAAHEARLAVLASEGEPGQPAG